MDIDFSKSRSRILYLIFASLALYFSGCLDSFILTVVPSILAAKKCFYYQPIFRNNSEYKEIENYLFFLGTSYMVSSQILIRLPGNILAGYFISKLGSEYIIMFGLMIYGASLVMYVFSNGCVNFLISRAVEGISESLTVTSAYSFLTSVFKKKTSKSYAIAFANFFYYIGIFFGSILGGSFYSIYGHDYIFIVLISIHLFLCGLSLVSLFFWKRQVEKFRVLNNIPFIETHVMRESNFFEIVMVFLNPYIIMICIGVAICTGSISILLAVLPEWVRIYFYPTTQDQGMFWILGGLVYGISELFSALIQKYWSRLSFICPLVGISLMSLGLATITFNFNAKFLCLNIVMIFLGIGLVDYYFFPLMSTMCEFIINRKSNSMAATLLTTSQSIGNLFGALVGGFISNFFGFKIACIIFGSFVGLYAPFTIVLSNYFSSDYENMGK